VSLTGGKTFNREEMVRYLKHKIPLNELEEGIKMIEACTSDKMMLQQGLAHLDIARLLMKEWILDGV
jgi:hypothetical protein